MNFASSVFRRSLVFNLVVAALSVAASAQVSVLTERYDKSRTGANLAETQLTTSNVNVNSFGKLWAYPVSGSVFAQPLYVPGVTIPGQGVKNVLYVATMNDVVYAFDADSNSTTPLWSFDLTTLVAGSTPVPIVDIVQSNSLNIVGNIGVESTPVIDPATNTIYLVARTKESGKYFQKLHALDITTGTEKFGGPTVIQGSVKGTGDASNGGTLTFDPLIHNQRSSLALANGQIYMSWSSHEDLNPYHGWVMSYNASTLQQTGIWCSTPNGYQGGIWMAGWAPAVDAAGNVYYLSGNGTWDGTKNFGESILKFGPAQGLALVDWFTPDDWATLNGGDIDMGSFGPLLVPGTDLIMGGGKEAIFYVAHTASLGHEQSGNGQIVQLLHNNSNEIKGGPVYWNRSGGVGPWLYVWANNDFLKAYHFNGMTFDTALVSESTFGAPSGASGGVLTLSANGSTAGSGIVWSSMPLNADGDHGVHPGVLRAFNADDLTKELWNSTQNAARDASGNWPKYSAPTVVNGRVYMASFPADGVGTTNLSVYGLLTTTPLVATPTFAPAPGSYTSAQSVTLADSTAGATIYYTTDSSSPTISSTVYTTPISVNATTTIKAMAAASGATNSAVASAGYVIGSSSGPGTPISQQGWSLLYVDSQETTGEYAPATNAFDGNANTFWHTQWSGANPPPPHEIQIKLGASYSIGAFSYLPRQGGCTNGYIGQYEFYVSTDGVNWGTPQASGTFDYGAGFHYGCDGTGTSTTARVITFPPVTGSYIRLRALSEIGGNPWTSMAELNIFSGSVQGAPIPSSVTLNPSTVTAGSTSTGTVTLNAAAPTGGTVVTLSSNNAAATVPANVTVVAGQTSANFTVTTTAGSSATATISASANGSTASATLTFQTAAPVPTALTLNPSTVNAGANSTATVTLNATAPTGGTVVTLSSNNAAATVPANVTVAAGQTSTTFTVTTTAGSSATATISASANGSTASGTLTVQAAVPVPSALTLNPSTVNAGANSTATVTLSAAAPTGGTVVTLSSNNAAATLPANVTVAAGQTSANFTVATVSGSNATATISASANGTTASGTLTVQPPAPVPTALTLNPSTVAAGANSTGTVTLNAAAPTGGTVVALSSNNAAATVPANVTVAAGQTSATFTVTTVAGSSATATISASANGSTASGTLTVQPAAPVPTTLTLSPSTVIGGASSKGTVILSSAAQSGGTIVTLSSNNAAATVPAKVTVLAGQTSGSFTINTVAGASATANILASANGTSISSKLVVQSYISQAAWTLKSVDSQETQRQNGAATNAFDGNTLSMWHTQWSAANPVPPHEIQINLGASYTLTGFSYLPRQDGCSNGTVAQYEFYVSTDGVNWGTAVSTGTFNYGSANLGCGGLPKLPQQMISFPAKTGQYIRFRALKEVNGQPWTSAAEINVMR